MERSRNFRGAGGWGVERKSAFRRGYGYFLEKRNFSCTVSLMIIYCSLLQAALQTLYALILFFLVVRGVYMLRPFRFFWRAGRIMSSAACSLLACMVSPHIK